MRSSRKQRKLIVVFCAAGAAVFGSLLGAGVGSARLPDQSASSPPAAAESPPASAEPATGATQPPGQATPSPLAPLTGTVNLVDKTWICNGPVALDAVNVTISGASKDAVYLRSGCTGHIGTINIVQYHGDGIHVNNGAHDLVVGGGTIRCFAHDQGKHQDGIQAMGGINIEFDNLDVGCYSANNSQVWINAGAGGNGTPTGVVFKGGRFQGYFGSGQYGPGGSYGIAIVNSISSGAIGATICPNAHPKRALYIGSSAVGPVNISNLLPSSCS